MPSSVRSFLLRPGVFFERRADHLSGLGGGALAVVAAIALTIITGIAVRLFTLQMTGTTEIDNPARPPEQFCEDGVSDMTPAGCDEPATRTVEIGALVWEQFTDILPWIFVVLLVFWVLFAVALHVGGLIAGGSGRFGETLEVTAWGLVPSVLAAGVGAGVFVLFALRMDLSGSSPETVTSQIEGIQEGISGLVLLAIQLGGAGWQAYVWAGGLRVVHEISRRAAVAVAIVCATVPVVLA